MSAMEEYNVVNEIQAMLTESGDGFENWNKVFNFVLQSKAYLRDLQDINNIVEALARKLLSSNCDDSEIVSRVIDMYNRWICKGFEMDGAIVNYILEPLDFVNSYQLFDGTDDDMFLMAVDRGDLNIVKLLVKYGQICKIDLFHTEKCEFLTEFKFIIKQRMFHQHVFHHDLADEWADEFLDVMFYTDGKIGNNQRSYRRMCVLLRVLSKLCLKIEDNKKNYIATHIQCLRIYFNAINEPFIAQGEMRDFLNLIFADEENCQEVVEEIICIYRGMFRSEITLVYEPRTLKHQSRCAVRKYLSSGKGSVTLPNLISEQHVPLVIKELLLGAPEFN